MFYNISGLIEDLLKKRKKGQKVNKFLEWDKENFTTIKVKKDAHKTSLWIVFIHTIFLILGGIIIASSHLMTKKKYLYMLIGIVVLIIFFQFFIRYEKTQLRGHTVKIDRITGKVLVFNISERKWKCINCSK